MKIAPSILEDDVYLPAPWRVLTALIQHPALTQAELRSCTGLSHPVIVQQVMSLREHGLLRSGEPLYGRPGRPRVPMTFNWHFRRVLAVDVHAEGVTLQAMNLAGEPQGRAHTAPAGAAPEALLEAISAVLALPGAPWAGIGVVLPSGTAHGRLVRPGDAQPDPLTAALTARFSLPVMVEHAGNALAQFGWAHAAATPGSVMAFSLRQLPRVDLGLIIDGQRVPGLARGTHGLGDIRQAGARTSTVAPALQALFAEPSHRAAAVHAAGSLAGQLAIALAPERLAVQSDAAWTDDDTAQFHRALHDHSSPEQQDLLPLELYPARPDECLSGITNLLITRLLDFRQGVVTGWLAKA